jgi:phosphoribosylanthranilate isomerase
MSGSFTWSETITHLIEPYAADIDCFILDGHSPGSGARIEAEIPANFPYPFLLAGGLQEGNLDAVLGHPNCIGVDIASGLETAEKVDLEKTRRIAQRLVTLSLPHDL